MTTFLAISGSLRAASTNTALVRALAPLTSDARVTIYEGLGDLPHFSPLAPDEASPAAVETLRHLVREADAVVICTPEYAYGMPGSLKNALDWLVTTGELSDKPVATLSASPSALGGQRAHDALLLTLTAMNAVVPEDARITVPFVRQKLSSRGDLMDEDTREALRTALAALNRAVLERPAADRA